MYLKQKNNLRLKYDKARNLYIVQSKDKVSVKCNFQREDDAEDFMKRTKDFLQKKGE